MKFNKLVRDKIPDSIRKQGNTPVTRVLDPESYAEELRRKLQEEVSEFLTANRVEELGDILEVVYALAAVAGVSPIQLEKIRKCKLEDRGGFGQRVFLEQID